MNISETAIKTKDNRFVVFRNPVIADAPYMIRFLKTICAETAFLGRDSSEVSEDIAGEEEFIQSFLVSDKSFMIVAQEENADDIAGRCTVRPYNQTKQCAHRCIVEIALYQKYCRIGIGERMLKAAIREAGNIGYTQAELEVLESNEAAISLYEKTGFIKVGRIPNASYDEASLIMVKKL